MHRCFVATSPGPPLRAGDRVTLDLDESRHVRTVLRTAPGAVVALTDGRGHALQGVLEAPDHHRCVVRITAVETAAAEVAAPLLHLACAVVKGRRFEYALEKAVELGAHTITPLLTERGVVDPGAGRLDRWHGLLVAALKQSGRCHLPGLHPPASPQAVLAAAPGEVWFGSAPLDSPPAAPRTLLQAAVEAGARRRDGAPAPGELLLLIGPEGGWSPAELALFAARGARPLALGPHVLRTETAAAAGLTALQFLRGVWLGTDHP